MELCGVASCVDYVEVGRKAHELEVAHGQDGARRYAAKLAAECRTENHADEHAFWRAVEMSLTVR